MDDLGGDCCSDLEERVAELEATTVRRPSKSKVVRKIVYGLATMTAALIVLLAFLLFLSPLTQKIAFVITFFVLSTLPVLTSPYFLTGPPQAA
jgi:VIT1/CCC1 family predicted Fe2+/Mn2+ transporter